MIGVGPDKKVVGIVTDRDLAVRVIAAHRDLEVTKVDEVMTPNLITVEALDSIEDAERLMRQHFVHRLPVVHRDGRPLGWRTLPPPATSPTVSCGPGGA